MRLTQPLNADEQRVDAVLRKHHRTHAEQDAALQHFRLAHRSDVYTSRQYLESVADLMLKGASR